MVANVLADEGGVDDITTLVAALLHDTIEDTQTTAEEIVAAFGLETAAVVLEVTDDKRLAKDERKRHQVLRAAESGERAKLVKLADKICNLRDLIGSPPANWPLERRREYFEWAREVVGQLRAVSPRLAAVFDAAYACKPRGRLRAGTSPLAARTGPLPRRRPTCAHRCLITHRRMPGENTLEEDNHLGRSRLAGDQSRPRRHHCAGAQRGPCGPGHRTAAGPGKPPGDTGQDTGAGWE
jgi:guanosine-3',5'-bis(diphosphate) 3'-pyrophosphohydrolase